MSNEQTAKCAIERINTLLTYLKVEELPSVVALEHVLRDLGNIVECLQYVKISRRDVKSLQLVELEAVIQAIIREKTRTRLVLSGINSLTQISSQKRAEHVENLIQALLVARANLVTLNDIIELSNVFNGLDVKEDLNHNDLLLLIELLEKVVHGKMSDVELKMAVVDANLIGLIQKKVEIPLATVNTLVQIGQDTQTGDITFRDVAGGNIINITINFG